MKIALLAEAVMLSWGWRRAAMAAVAGAVGALAMPPFGLWPLLAVPFAAAVWLLDGVASPSPWRRARQAFADGWFWGFGYFVGGLWWLGAAFLVEADRFAWAMPLGVLGLPAMLALFPAAGFVLASSLWTASPWRALVLAGALGLAEMGRAHLFTGFPWNAFGQALAENAWLAQGAALVGLHGLTVLAIFLAAAPAAVLASRASARGVAALWLAALGGLALHGALRLPAGDAPLAPGVKLRIMQPNLPQDAKFHPELARDIIERYVAISDRATTPRTLGLQDVTHLIWPESAFPLLIARTPWALQRVMSALPPHVTLVTGAARAGVQLPGEGRPPIYNAIHVITREGGVLASYDKSHLVPFGEYLPAPFEGALRLLGLKEFVAVPGGFAAAAARRPLEVPGLPPVAATICYEAIFPGEVLPEGEGPRPGLILNVTNDAWFGITPGPHQHVRQARLRAIEEGLPLVRAANNGVSAVIDPYGRTLAQLPLGTEGVLDSGLPQPIGLTTFSRVGHAPAWAGIFLALAFGLTLRWRGRAARAGRPK